MPPSLGWPCSQDATCRCRRWLPHARRSDGSSYRPPLAHYSRPSQSRARWSPSSGNQDRKGDLLIGRSKHHLLNRFEALHLFFELDQLLLEPRGPGHKLLRRRLTGSCLAIGCVKLAQIARNALLDLRQAPLHLSLREVVVARVNRFELAAVDRNARFRQQTHLAAQGNELRADLLDGRAVVFAEIGDGFVIRDEPSRQPHHFPIAGRLAL